MNWFIWNQLVYPIKENKQILWQSPSQYITPTKPLNFTSRLKFNSQKNTLNQIWIEYYRNNRQHLIISTQND